MLNIKKGFTLSEVILTLTIVGVVMGLTFPTLNNSFNMQELRIAWKKIYNITANAIDLYNAENGSFVNKCNDANCFKNLLKDNMNVAIDCPVASQCWNKITTVPQATFSTLNGAFVGINFLSKACTNAVTNVSGICATMTIDVNGAKGPNIEGMDVQLVYLRANDVTPYGANNDGNDCIDNKGKGCASKYLYEAPKNEAPPVIGGGK